MARNQTFRDLGRQLRLAAIAVVLTVAALSHAYAAQPSYRLTNLGDHATIFTSHSSAAFESTMWVNVRFRSRNPLSLT